MRACRVALLCLVAMALIGQVFGDSITFRPSADTTLFAVSPGNNLGSNSNLLSGANGSGFPGRALIRFDLANRIPSNAVIQSVSLAVNVVIVPGGGGVDSSFDVRRVLADWGEGMGTGNTGSPPNDGEATWNNRFHASTPWTVPGGAISNDFSGTVSAAMLIGSPGVHTFGSTTNLVTDVQEWLLNPVTNFGWALISESENTAFTARRFGSREDTNNAPLLIVEYALPATLRIQWIKTADGQIQFGFVASIGQPYIVQYRDSLMSWDWLTLTNVAPQITTTNVLVLDPFSTNAQRYYRIGAF